MPVSQQVELASIQRGPTIARLCGDAKCWPSAAATVVPSGRAVGFRAMLTLEKSLMLKGQHEKLCSRLGPLMLLGAARTCLAVGAALQVDLGWGRCSLRIPLRIFVSPNFIR